MELEVDPSAAASIGTRLHQRSQQASKKSLKRSAALRERPAGSGGKPSLDKEMQWLQQCQQLYGQLPSSSKYARHKRRVVQKAMELLQIKRCERRCMPPASELQGGGGSRPAHTCRAWPRPQAGEERGAGAAAGIVHSSAQAID